MKGVAQSRLTVPERRAPHPEVYEQNELESVDYIFKGYKVEKELE